MIPTMEVLQTRRNILKYLGIATAVSALSRVQAIGANERIRIAVIGTGSKGGNLIDVFGSLANVSIIAVCDPDSSRMEKAADSIVKRGLPKPDQQKDFRKLLERDDIDAVVIASPNHWHALQTIMACQAGKDVYVEKPASFTIAEGRMMVNATAQHNRIVQVGLQSRSDTGMHEAIRWLGEGHIGALKSIHAFWFRTRESIGKRSSPLKPPATVDYDLWLGPAQDLPIYRNHLHYDWHWDWNTGNGDLANLGTHTADMARCFLGDPGPPTGVTSFGNHFGWDDANMTPNVHVAAFDYKIPLTVEINSLAMEPGKSRQMAYKKIGSGVVASYEGGEFRGFGGGKVYDTDGKQIHAFKSGNPVLEHAKNFIAAVISRRANDLNCPISTGHTSTTICLLGNAAWRSGNPVSQADLKTKCDDHPALGEVLHRYSEQLANWDVDFNKTPWIASPSLDFDPDTEAFVGGHAQSAAPFLQRETYRKPFQLPEV